VTLHCVHPDHRASSPLPVANGSTPRLHLVAHLDPGDLRFDADGFGAHYTAFRPSEGCSPATSKRGGGNSGASAGMAKATASEHGRGLAQALVSAPHRAEWNVTYAAKGPCQRHSW
jgi:hypothetical protein